MTRPSSFQTGRNAEAVASAYLERHDFTVIKRNWRTRWCEIDIIARRDTVLYFVEVKFRLSNAFGSGLDYITPKKLAQMTRAAQGFVNINNWEGDYQLCVLALGGPKVSVHNFIIVT